MLNRDQWSAEEFLRSGALLYQAFGAPDERAMQEALLALDGAVASFGRAEMIDRQVERQRVVKLRKGRPGSDELFAHYQHAGLRALSDAKQSLAELRRHAERSKHGETDARALEERLSAFERSVKIELASLELKPADVRKLVVELDAVLAVARRGDPAALLDHIGQKVDELASVRGGADRGMIDNIPWWKVVAVAVFFGITVWALIKCVWRWFGWSCSTNEALVYALIAKAAALGYRLC